MWFQKLHEALTRLGYKQSKSDYTLFYLTQGQDTTLILAYVDDLVIAGNNISNVIALNYNLSSFFQIKDLGHLNFFLGLEFSYTTTGIYVGQRKYTFDLLDSSCYTHAKPMENPAARHTLTQTI